MSASLINIRSEATSARDEEPNEGGAGVGGGPAAGVGAGGADDGDTSFEIDDPEDEETVDDVLTINSRLGIGVAAPVHSTYLINNCTCTDVVGTLKAATSPAAAAVEEACFSGAARDTLTRFSVPAVHVRTKDADSFDAPSDVESSSSIDGSQTGSSTPTTADVADMSSALAAIVKTKEEAASKSHIAKLMPHCAPSSIQHRVSCNGSLAEDNLSASVATTTTEVDLEAALATSNLQQSSSSDDNRFPIAALRETDVVAREAASKATGSYQIPPDGVGHKRTQSSSSYLSMGAQSHSSQPGPSMQRRKPQMWLFEVARCICVHFKNSGIGEPSVYHALVVIFLEFFAWGLLTMPVIAVLNQTFPDHTFLMNGLVMGIKGILSFLSAPLIGALSDIWGRKFFLLITVFFTCAPIPLMTINTWWFFALISISGVFAVTFSVVFAYVADVTTVEERSRAYGLVSATFAASLVISPALGAALMEMYSDTLVVALATAIAVLDVFFILVAVPESLPEKVRPSSWGAPISWEQADPFAALRKVGTDHTILMQCVTVLLSYLPEAGQYSCIFVYLKLKMGFNSMEVAIFIALVGILSICVQVTLGYLMRVFGGKRTIILGLVLEMMQLLWYGFGSQAWMMWAAGVLAALGSITYPAISAFVSIHSDVDQQGAVQGMVTGMRGLCNGLGPAMFGVIFYLFNVDLNDEKALAIIGDVDGVGGGGVGGQNGTHHSERYMNTVPGPPFAFGALMVVLAIMVAVFIPDARTGEISLSRAPSEKKRVSIDVEYEIEDGGLKVPSPLSPLMHSESFAKL